MNQARTDGLRSIELGVRDLQKSAEFYRKVWALEDVAAEGDSIHLRATGTDHHVVTLRERPAYRFVVGCQMAAQGVASAAARRMARQRRGTVLATQNRLEG